MVGGITKMFKNFIKYTRFNVGTKELNDIIEYDLLDFNENMEKAWRTILVLYGTVLNKDNYWHLFYEGSFSTIRCSLKYKKEVEEFFNKYNIKFKYNGLWKDGSRIVEKYKDIYKHIFHEFSMLAIVMDEDDLFQAADRVCHSFFNHHYYTATEHRRPFSNLECNSAMSTTGPDMWEAEMMSRILIYRAHYIGKFDAITFLQKGNKQEEENDK